MDEAVLTRKQRDQLDILSSHLDNLEWEEDVSPGAIVFSGDDADGPRTGYISSDGEVTWLC